MNLPTIAHHPNLGYSPTAETLMAKAPQNPDCFLDKSLDWLLASLPAIFRSRHESCRLARNLSCWCYQTSFPTAVPLSISVWRFSGVSFNRSKPCLVFTSREIIFSDCRLAGLTGSVIAIVTRLRTGCRGGTPGWGQSPHTPLNPVS